MNKYFATIFLYFISFEASLSWDTLEISDYRIIFILQITSSYFLPQIDETVEYINNQIEGWADYFYINFYSYHVDAHDLLNQSSYLGVLAVGSADIEARNHVIDKRQNYTEYLDTITSAMMVTRESVTKDIRDKKETIFWKAADVYILAREIGQILRSEKQCTEAQANDFYDYYSAKIQTLVIDDIQEACDLYYTLIFRSYLPLYLVSNVFEKFINCFIKGVEVLDCIRRVEGFYLRFSFDICWES